MINEKSRKLKVLTTRETLASYSLHKQNNFDFVLLDEPISARYSLTLKNTKFGMYIQEKSSALLPLQVLRTFMSMRIPFIFVSDILLISDLTGVSSNLLHSCVDETYDSLPSVKQRKARALVEFQRILTLGSEQLEEMFKCSREKLEHFASHKLLEYRKHDLISAISGGGIWSG